MIRILPRMIRLMRTLLMILGRTKIFFAIDHCLPDEFHFYLTILSLNTPFPSIVAFLAIDQTVFTVYL